MRGEEGMREGRNGGGEEEALYSKSIIRSTCCSTSICINISCKLNVDGKQEIKRNGSPQLEQRERQSVENGDISLLILREEDGINSL